jgi:lysosomal acid lipase/cholesteryl ester hydrolase
MNTEQKSIAIVMANRGYDVWLGNNRGTKYSLGSIKKRNEKEYFDFSFQNMGRYDVPANIKKILKITGQPNLIYAGHSQGTS